MHKRPEVHPTSPESVVLQEWADPLLLQRAIADPAAASPADILTLQRTVGNRAVSRLIQAKLAVGPMGDRYEQEADRVAEQVMGLPAISPRATSSHWSAPPTWPPPTAAGWG